MEKYNYWLSELSPARFPVCSDKNHHSSGSDNPTNSSRARDEAEPFPRGCLHFDGCLRQTPAPQNEPFLYPQPKGRGWGDPLGPTGIHWDSLGSTGMLRLSAQPLIPRDTLDVFGGWGGCGSLS